MYDSTTCSQEVYDTVGEIGPIYIKMILLTVNNNIECLLRAKHCFHYFTCVNSFNPPSDPIN